MNKKQIGTFWFDIDRVPLSILTQVFNLMRFVPIRVEYMYAHQKLEATGYSTLFAEKEDHVQIPEYKVFYLTSDGENVICATCDLDPGPGWQPVA